MALEPRDWQSPPPIYAELMGIETQDFSPSARNDRCLSHRLFKADPFPKFAEGHLAVCNSAACVVSFIAHLTGRCFAKADALPLIC